MNTTITLSDAAIALLRDYRGDIVTDDTNREACRELAAAGYLVAGHTFVGGREVFYRMTRAGADLAPNLGGCRRLPGHRLQDPPRSLADRQIGLRRRLQSGDVIDGL